MTNPRLDMTPYFIYVFLILFINNRALSLEGFNFTAPYESEGSHRDGKFLFDSFFGLELEDELIANAGGTNTLKSCDCGQYLVRVIRKERFSRLDKKLNIKFCATHALDLDPISDLSIKLVNFNLCRFSAFLLYHSSSVSLRC